MWKIRRTRRRRFTWQVRQWFSSAFQRFRVTGLDTARNSLPPDLDVESSAYANHDDKHMLAGCRNIHSYRVQYGNRTEVDQGQNIWHKISQSNGHSTRKAHGMYNFAHALMSRISTLICGVRYHTIRCACLMNRMSQYWMITSNCILHIYT